LTFFIAIIHSLPEYPFIPVQDIMLRPDGNADEREHIRLWDRGLKA